MLLEMCLLGNIFNPFIIIYQNSYDEKITKFNSTN